MTLPLRLALLLILLPAALGAFQPVASRMTERLRQTLLHGDSTATVEAIIYLRDELDLDALRQGTQLSSAGRKARHAGVVTALQAVSQQSQAGLIALLETAAQSGEVRSWRSFWINNCLAVTARPGFLARLSEREEIEWMTHDRSYGLPVEPAAQTRPADYLHPDSLRKYSWPIRALGLEQLWNAGLTGKGTLICVIGAGIDGRHSLLAPKWRGNNGGTAAASWFDPIDGSSFPFDDEPNGPSHETGVTGIILAGERSLGVAYEAQWIGAKIFDNQNLTDDGASSTKDSYMIAAFQWAADPDGNPETVADVPDVINNSWGTLGEFQEDICRPTLWRMLDRIEAAGTVVVFSAGNEGPDPWTVGSPASRALSPYNAFAVGSVDQFGRLSAFSSRGPSACDSTSIKPNLCAPGEEVVTIRASNYSFPLSVTSGTSFAAPYISGLAALVRQADPTLGAEEVKRLLVETAFDAGLPGPDFGYGYGVVDPATLLSRLETPDQPRLYSKHLRIEDNHAGGNGNGYIEQGELIHLLVPVYNSGAPAEGISAVLRSSSPEVELIDSTAWYGDLPRYDGHDSGSDHLVFRVRPEAPSGSQAIFYLALFGADGALVQTIQAPVTIAPAVEGVAVHTAGSFDLTITNYGLFGARAAGLAGEGLRFPRNAPYTILHRGGLVLGTSSLKVSDAIREMDFAPAPGGPIRLIENGGRADQEGLAFLREKSEGALNAIGVRLRQSTLAWKDSPNDDFVIFEYSVHNPHPAAIRNLYLGLYADWDIPDSLPSRDAVGFDQALQLGYVWNPQQPQLGYGGLVPVTDHRVSGHRAVSNWRFIHQGYTDAAAFSFLSGGLSQAASDSLDDWSQLLASGPHAIEPGDSLVVAWALVTGESLDDLQANARAAREKYRGSLALAASGAGQSSGTRLPREFELGQNRPNPFNPSTTIDYRLPAGTEAMPVRLTVYDLRGREVIRLVEATQAGGFYSVQWDGSDREGRRVASGVYFYRLEAGGRSTVRKMVILK